MGQTMENAFLNEEYILKLIKPKLNVNQELSELEFFELFSNITLYEQYEVINIMIAHAIELVDEKVEEKAIFDKVDALRQKNDDQDFHK